MVCRVPFWGFRGVLGARGGASPGWCWCWSVGEGALGKWWGNFPGRPGGSPRASSLSPLRYAAGDSTQLAQWSGSGGPVR